MSKDNLKKNLGLGSQFKKTQEEAPPKKEISYEEHISKEEVLATFEQKRNKPKVEDTHIRRTFLIKRELDDKLDLLADRQGHGFKTHFINEAIKSYLNMFDDEI